MKRIALLILITLCLAIGAAALYVWFSAPQKLETALNQALTEAGLTNTVLPAARTHPGRAIYQDIAFDEKRFSTLKKLTIAYNPIKLVLFGQVEQIRIEGLDLTGELTPRGQVIIAGWNKPKSLHLPMKTANIEIENARLSLLSEELGGITLQLSAQLRPQPRTLTLQGRLKAEQRQLSIDANLEGQITDEGFGDLRMEIEQGKFIMDTLRATRLAGLINISGQNIKDVRLLGELEAGGLNVAGLPWQEAALTLEGTVHAPRMILAAKSAGVEGLELGLTISNIRTPQRFNGTIHANTLNALTTYLNQNLSLTKPQNLKKCENNPDIDILFANQKSLTFDISNEAQDIDKSCKEELKTVINTFWSGKTAKLPE